MIDPPADAGNHWERVASEWMDWARAPGHDAYWYYRRAFREFVPSPGTATLEIGCGEGRIARDLSRLGHRVTATDISPSLLRAAEKAASAERYVPADAGALPFADHSFDRVVAYNVFMDVPDMPAAVAEAGRVLTPGVS
jgi:ubiquinone/menaquinone biosynthesis C-methylase UbiE